MAVKNIHSTIVSNVGNNKLGNSSNKFDILGNKDFLASKAGCEL
jgi:hypothetical protein